MSRYWHRPILSFGPWSSVLWPTILTVTVSESHVGTHLGRKEKIFYRSQSLQSEKERSYPKSTHLELPWDYMCRLLSSPWDQSHPVLRRTKKGSEWGRRSSILTLSFLTNTGNISNTRGHWSMSGCVICRQFLITCDGVTYTTCGKLKVVYKI